MTTFLERSATCIDNSVELSTIPSNYYKIAYIVSKTKTKFHASHYSYNL